MFYHDDLVATFDENKVRYFYFNSKQTLLPSNNNQAIAAILNFDIWNELRMRAPVVKDTGSPI